MTNFITLKDNVKDLIMANLQKNFWYEGSAHTSPYQHIDSTEHSVLRTKALEEYDKYFEDTEINKKLKSRGGIRYQIQIGYFFNENKRQNRVSFEFYQGQRNRYGSMASFAHIYSKLVETTGIDFVKVYFSKVFPDVFRDQIIKRFERSIPFERLESFLGSPVTGVDEETQQHGFIDNVDIFKQFDYDEVTGRFSYEGLESRITKEGKLDKRFKASAMLHTLASKEASRNHTKVLSNKQVLMSLTDTISYEIKAHIQQCLATGAIPVNFTHKPRTARKRVLAGLTPLRAFYATGQLVDNLVIFFDFAPIDSNEYEDYFVGNPDSKWSWDLGIHSEVLY